VPGDPTSVLAAEVCAAFVTAAEPVLIPLLGRAAVDTPDTRLSRSVPAPRSGPLAVVAALAALLLVQGTVAIMFAVAVAAFAAIGLADKLAGLPTSQRLRTQRAAPRRWLQLGQPLLADSNPVAALSWPNSLTRLDSLGPQRSTFSLLTFQRLDEMRDHL
jgi:hypothetical protein